MPGDLKARAMKNPLDGSKITGARIEPAKIANPQPEPVVKSITEPAWPPTICANCTYYCAYDGWNGYINVCYAHPAKHDLVTGHREYRSCYEVNKGDCPKWTEKPLVPVVPPTSGAHGLDDARTDGSCIGDWVWVLGWGVAGAAAMLGWVVWRWM